MATRKKSTKAKAKPRAKRKPAPAAEPVAELEPTAAVEEPRAEPVVQPPAPAPTPDPDPPAAEPPAAVTAPTPEPEQPAAPAPPQEPAEPALREFYMYVRCPNTPKHIGERLAEMRRPTPRKYGSGKLIPGHNWVQCTPAEIKARFKITHTDKTPFAVLGRLKND